jgi:hypothetical protein
LEKRKVTNKEPHIAYVAVVCLNFEHKVRTASVENLVPNGHHLLERIWI